MATHGLTRAIEDAGGVEALAGRLGVSERTIFAWKARGIPLLRVPRVARLTGIPKHELHPEFAPVAPAPAPEAAA